MERERTARTARAARAVKMERAARVIRAVRAARMARMARAARARVIRAARAARVIRAVARGVLYGSGVRRPSVAPFERVKKRDHIRVCALAPYKQANKGEAFKT